MFETVGVQMAEAFKKTGRSQVKFAQASGIDQAHLSKLLRGTRRWNLGLLEKANKALVEFGLDPVILGASEPQRPPPQKEQAHHDELERYKAREDRLWRRIDDLEAEVAELKKVSAAISGRPSKAKSPEKKAL